MRPNCPCSLTGEHDVYSNIERQLGKLAKVTAFLEYKQKFYCGSILSLFAGIRAGANANVLFRSKEVERGGKEERFCPR
jgi:hypothetical protein